PSVTYPAADWMTDGLVAHYPFNGNADDETGNGYDGETIGATLTADRNGKSNSAYSFNGTNDYIALDMFYGVGAGSVADTVDELTVCALVKSASLKDQIIISFDRSEYWRLSLVDYPDDQNATPYVAWDSANASEGYNDLSTSTNYADGQWHFICATYNLSGNKKQIYVDGRVVASSSISESLGTGMTRYGFIGVGSEADTYDGLKMIKAPYTNTIFSGVIDEVIIFDTTLTDDQIYLLYQQVISMDE
ncbi:LamG domain-containing protein, partial [bacterium]|nr:LamG domain-containing protein [bacterium]